MVGSLVSLIQHRLVGIIKCDLQLIQQVAEKIITELMFSSNTFSNILRAWEVGIYPKLCKIYANYMNQNKRFFFLLMKH